MTRVQVVMREEIPGLRRLLERDEIRPSLELGRFEDEIDLERLTKTCMFFSFEDGLVIAEILRADCLRIHVVALPGARGRRALGALNAVIAYCAARGFHRFEARVHKENCGAQMLAGAVGFQRASLEPDHIVYELNR